MIHGNGDCRLVDENFYTGPRHLGQRRTAPTPTTIGKHQGDQEAEGAIHELGAPHPNPQQAQR